MATSIFLQLDGFTGSSKVEKYEGQMEVVSASIGGTTTVITQGGGGGSALGKVSIGPLVISKNYDSASPQLFVAMCTGKSIATGKLSFVLDGVGPYLTFDFKALRVGSMTTSSSGGPAVDTLNLAYETVMMTYRDQLPDGSFAAPVVTGWDLTKNAPITPPTLNPVINKLPIDVVKRVIQP